MPAQTLSEFLREHTLELSKAIASRVRMDNPSFADRNLSDIRVVGERMCMALSEFLSRLDWAPLGEFVDEVARVRPAEFRVSDVIGALTTAERTVVRFVEDHDPNGALRASPQWARLEAGLHKLRTAVVECIWEAASLQLADRLEHAMSHLEQNDFAGALADLKKARAFLSKGTRRRARTRG